MVIVKVTLAPVPGAVAISAIEQSQVRAGPSGKRAIQADANRFAVVDGRSA